MIAVQRGSVLMSRYTEEVHQVSPNKVALDPDPAVHLPVAAERQGVLVSGAT